MKKKLHLLLFMLAAIVSMTTMAAVPNGYYNNAKNKSDQALMSALHSIIKGHTKRTYTQLWTDFKKTDCNGSTIIDRYSTTQFTYSTDQCGSYSGVGDCYNREHSVPNSWWGGSSSDTAYTDLHHMFPVDGWVNSQRGNNPFGDCANGTPKGTGKLGSCTFSGYSGTVFEVADEYKGDFARVYFYFATRYMTRISNYTSAQGSVVFTSNSYKCLTSWAINQLLEWHRNDPVSALEIARNDSVYGIQKNRNPFVDNPELVEYIWGNMQGNAWGGGTTPTPTPTLSAPTNGSTINIGTNTGSGVSKTITVSGSNLTKSVTIAVNGTGFSVSPTTLTASSVNSGTTVIVTYNGTATNATGTLTISSSEVSATVNLTASYNSGTGPTPGDEIVETWEGCGTGGYWTQVVQGHAFSWNFSNAGIWADANKNDALSCRFGRDANSYIEMTEDVTNGASKVTFYAANWGTDAAPTLQLQYSANGGNTWTTAGSCSPGSTWQQYSFDLNISGTVRFRILQTAGSRLNIDDIAITANGSSPVLTPELTAPVNGSTVNVGTIPATGTSVSKSITVKGSDLTKSLNVGVSGAGFSVTPTTISATNANAGTTVTVTYSSTVSGDATGTLVIASSEVSATVNLTAGKDAMPVINISPVATIEAMVDGESSIVQSTVTSENNTENITLSVDGNFELSLNRTTWLRSLTLDPTGETFYIRLADTGTVGEYYGTITATTSIVSAYADVEGIVTAKPVTRGDVNMDGIVSIDDVTALIDFLLGTGVTIDEQAADVDASGDIDINDVTALIDILLGVNNRTWNAMPTTSGIFIEIFNENEILEIYDMDAVCLKTVEGSGVFSIDLPAGIYIVSGDNRSCKVVVK